MFSNFEIGVGVCAMGDERQVKVGATAKWPGFVPGKLEACPISNGIC